MLQRIIICPATPADATIISDIYFASRRTFIPYAPMAHSEKAVRQWIAQTLIPSGNVGIALHQNKKELRALPSPVDTLGKPATAKAMRAGGFAY